jgi:hypothetical protein
MRVDNSKRMIPSSNPIAEPSPDRTPSRKIEKTQSPTKHLFSSRQSEYESLLSENRKLKDLLLAKEMGK